MKALSEVKAGETTELRAIYDENGNITEYEEVKVEAPKKEEPKEEEEEEEEEEEDVVILDSEQVGMTEEDLEEEEKAAKEENKKKQAELSRKAAELANIPEGPERDAARKKLLEESVIALGPVETMTYTQTRV